MWLLHHDFKRNIREWWDEGEEQGWAGFRFMMTLKFVKEKLEVWNKEVFGDGRIRKNEVLGEIEVLDSIKSEGRGNEELIRKRMDYGVEK